MNDLRRDLERILPENHPFFEKFDRAMTPAEPAEPEEKGEADGSTDYLNLVEQVVGVVYAIDDWKRGIRDWDEVETKLNEVREVTT